MRTGLKTLLIQSKKILKRPSLLFNNGSSFPKKGSSRFRVSLELYSLANELAELKLENKHGSFHCVPHPVAIETWKRLLKHNPNNLGNWSLSNQKNLYGTRKIERELITTMIRLLGGNEKEWEGYVTNGATESNIFSIWLGRKILERNRSCKRIGIVVNSLTHYSIIKAADITNIDIVLTDLNRVTWSTDIDALVNNIREQKDKYQGFLIPLTLGYTQTGTNDDYENICHALKELGKKLNISTYVFIDAALSGLVLPFTVKNFIPLKNADIQTFCVDFHKSGMTPIPSGIILYRKNLRKHIEKQITYVEEKDNTISGSRSGIPIVAMLSVIKQLGKDGFMKIMNKRISRKDLFIQQALRENPHLEISGDPRGISLGLITPNAIQKNFRDKYGLYSKRNVYKFTNSKERLYIYKAIILNTS